VSKTTLQVPDTSVEVSDTLLQVPSPELIELRKAAPPSIVGILFVLPARRAFPPLDRFHCRVRRGRRAESGE